MALFKRDFNKPGPGVPKNAPRKKGFARLFEILGRDFSSIVKLNLIFFICVLPAQLLFSLSVLFYGNFILFAGLALVASIPVGPALTAMIHGMSKMLRDDPGFVWHDFKKQFKENFKRTTLPGILYSAIIGGQLYAIIFYLFSTDTTSIAFIAVFIFSVFIFWMTARYFFLQASYLELGVGGLLKNSLLLALGNAPRSLGAALITVAFGVLQLWNTAITLPITPLVGYALPCLFSLMLVWPPVNKTFKIEETLKARADEQAKGDAESFGENSTPDESSDEID